MVIDKTKIILIIFFAFASNLIATNNSIAYIIKTENKCLHAFRDTIGTRSFTPNSYYWDFGDGHTSNLQHDEHDYLSNGDFWITHIISDGNNYDTAYFKITVDCKSNKPLKADFSFSYNDSTLFFQFHNLSEGRYTSQFWVWGDGTESYYDNPKKIYSSNIAQTYTVCLFIEDSVNKGRDSICKSVFVNPLNNKCKNKANFRWEEDTVCNRVILINESYDALSYYWDLGDGEVSNSYSLVHQYNTQFNQKEYKVELIANYKNCSDTHSMKIVPKCRNCRSIKIKGIYVYEDFYYRLSSARIYLIVHGKPILSELYDFGDGYTTTKYEPYHIYRQSGFYRFTYIVTDIANCSDTAFVDFHIDSLGNIKRGEILFTLTLIDSFYNTDLSIENIKANTIKTYPQPANEKLEIQFNDDLLHDIFIYNQIGQLVYNGHQDSSEINIISTSEWSNGIYYITDQYGNKNKIIILH